MDNFENLNVFDFLPDLPNELLNLSSYVQEFSPIHSPDDRGTQVSEIQPAQIPTSSNQIESYIEEKSIESPEEPFRSFDFNSDQTRPRRAAAMAANFWISSLKRRGVFDDSDKENEYNLKNDPKTNLMKNASKKRKYFSKKKISPFGDKNKENSVNQFDDTFEENKIDKELEGFLGDTQTIKSLENLVDIPIEFIPNNQPNYEFSNQENEDFNSNLLYPSLNDPLLNNAINPACDPALEVATSLNTPTRIDKSLVFCLSDNLCYDDSNYEKDDLGFTISRAVEPSFETNFQFNSDGLNEPLVDLNNNYLPPVIQQSSQDKAECENTESMFYEGVDLLKLSHGKRVDKLVGYANNVIKVLFNKNEIKHGIFPDKEGKTRSKCRTPFDNYRTEILKEAILKKFNYNPLSCEKLWINIRPLINKSLNSLRKSA